MIKMLHMIFILLSISSFVGRVYLAEKQPDMLEQKWIKTRPAYHQQSVIDYRFYLGFSGFVAVRRIWLDCR